MMTGAGGGEGGCQPDGHKMTRDVSPLMAGCGSTEDSVTPLGVERLLWVA